MPYWKQVDAPRKGTLQWLYPVWSTPDSEILEKCGLDAYCFMRYLNLLLRIFCPLALVVMPLLLPINITSDDQQPQSGLDILSIANVAPRYTATRLWIHCVMSLSTIAWICYQFYYEFHSYVRIKQKSFSSAASHSRASCTTILVRDLPAGYDERETLERLFGCFPGGVKNVWINRNHDHIAALVEYQTKTRDLLEEHETILIKSCQAKNLPCLAEENTTPRAQASSSAPQTNTVLPRWQRRFRRLSRVYQADIPNLRLVYPRWVPRLFRYDELKAFLDAHPEADAAWRKFMKPSERASLRLPLLRTTWWPSLPGLGHKVDRIYYLRYTLAELNSRIDRLKSRSEHSRSLRCAFVQFNRQIAAHMACQSVTHHSPHTMAPRIIGVGPSDVLWENLSLSWWQRIFRNILAVFLGALVILLFAVPVTFTSLLNNLDLLASRVTWLSWLTALPLPLKSVLQGLLPPLLLQILLLLIPPTYRYVAEFQGAATAGARELSVQSWYFVFLFTQVSFSVFSKRTNLC